ANGNDEHQGEAAEEPAEQHEEIQAVEPVAEPAPEADEAADSPADQEPAAQRRAPARSRGRRAPRHERHQPMITDLLKEGQEILVQIAKEPIAKKGARITSHIALPGRFLVYMPTVEHLGVCRKIE